MSGDFDRRVTPARPDLAAAHLQGKVTAGCFAEGRILKAARGVVPLRAAPSDDAGQETQVLFGEGFTVYEEKNGWVWGQAALDDYVGYASADDFAESHSSPTHRVTVLATPLLGVPDAKSPMHDMLPLNAKVTVVNAGGRFSRLDNGLYVFARHLAALTAHQSDWVAVAESFLGVAYVWGGKTQAGLDCSGLVQTSLEAAGIPAPRDTDMMEKTLGHAVTPDIGLRRGDLIFWEGHVGLMVDGTHLLHANGFAMQVTRELFADVRERTLTRENLPIRTIKRF